MVPRPAAPAGGAAPPTNPQSGQGLDGQINPDRTAPGPASLDAAADELWGVYVSTLNRQIDQNWQRITVSALRQAKVQFEIDRQGRLINLRLVESSGDPSADTVALQAVRVAAPFAPFPTQTTESQLRVNFTFTYYPADESAASQTLSSPQPLTPAQ
jgi:TonB family protein